MEVGEDDRDLRHDERHQKDQDEHADRQHQQRVGQRGRHRVAQARLPLEELGQAQEHAVERPAGLPDPHHVHVQRREHRGVGRQRVGERRALADPFTHRGDDALDGCALDLFAERGERIHQGRPAVKSVASCRVRTDTSAADTRSPRNDRRPARSGAPPREPRPPGRRRCA
jgi:hypothetical protein